MALSSVAGVESFFFEPLPLLFFVIGLGGLIGAGRSGGFAVG